MSVMNWQWHFFVPAYDTHRRNLRQDVELVVGG